MIKFGHIISEAGFDSYSPLSEIKVKIFDRKDRELKESEFNFNKNLFSRNSNSKEKFRELLERESKNSILPDKIYFPGQPPYFFPLF